jgi:uncharacterized protein YcbK (DUF882 family)
MILRYFQLIEFACRHCGVVHMDPAYLLEVDELRHRYGRSLFVNSGYRCPVHNAEVSATGLTGPHTTGCASDLRVSHGDAFALLQIALTMRFIGIGVAQKGADRYLHLDTLPDAPGRPRPTIWSY